MDAAPRTTFSLTPLARYLLMLLQFLHETHFDVVPSHCRRHSTPLTPLLRAPAVLARLLITARVSGLSYLRVGLSPPLATSIHTQNRITSMDILHRSTCRPCIRLTHTHTRYTVMM